MLTWACDPRALSISIFATQRIASSRFGPVSAREGGASPAAGSGTRAARHRWQRPLTIAVLLLAAAVAALIVYRRVAGAAVDVQQTSIALVYPYQSVTVLNATGYVVAQRKASVASKATGRLEWLGVQEGSRVRRNEVIARLESQDVAAARDQAAASVRVARANVEQADAELREAQRALERSADLLSQEFVSQAAHDIVVGRVD